MIQIDLSWAVADYLIIILCIAIGLWVFYNFTMGAVNVTPSQSIQQCPFCAHIYIDHTAETLKTCPQCHSLYETEGGAGQKRGGAE